MKINNEQNWVTYIVKFKLKNQSTEKPYFIVTVFQKKKRFPMVIFIEFQRPFTAKLDLIYEFK